MALPRPRNRVVHRLSLSRAILLAVAAIVALAGPILVGIVNVEAGGGEPAIRSVVKSGLPKAGMRESAGRATAIQQYRVGEIKITGVKVMHSDVVRSLLGLTSGEAYDESRLHKGFRNLTKLYGSFGHVNFLPEP